MAPGLHIALGGVRADIRAMPGQSSSVLRSRCFDAKVVEPVAGLFFLK